MPLILLTNDDGIAGPGLTALREAIGSLGRVIVIAPDRDNSAVSHALTMNRPLRLQRHSDSIYTLDGTPTDCVAVGLGKILEKKPDLLISGINAGPNLGDDITYSGTVSAAVEGTMYSIPSMAVSLAGEPPYDFGPAGLAAARLAAMILARGLPENTLMNINIPQAAVAGTKVTRQGRRLWENSIHETYDPRGRKYYWIGGGTPVRDSALDTDVHAIQTGFISVTPIHLDWTNHEGIFHLKNDWQLEQEDLTDPDTAD